MLQTEKNWLSCIKSGVINSSAMLLSIIRGQSTPLLRELNIWFEYGIRPCKAI